MVWRPRTDHGRKHGTGGEMVIQGDLTPNRPLRKQLQFHREFVDYATVLIGLYAAASGIPEFLILLVEDIVAFGSDFGDNKDWDPIFRNLPERNVKNTDMGYLLYNSGRIAPLSKP